MKIGVDLHIHSCLSPCADDDMTPCNITAMAALKGLDAIAITDHNSAGNVAAAVEAGRDAGIYVVPGLEVNTREEVHLLCYFSSVSSAEIFGTWIHDHLPPIPNDTRLFGNQFFCNAQDEITGMEPYLLINAIDQPMERIVEYCKALGGIAVPAHVDRTSNSLLSNLGFVPEGMDVACMEVWGNGDLEMISPYGILRSSDAHTLGSILENGFTLDVRDLSCEEILYAISELKHHI